MAISANLLNMHSLQQAYEELLIKFDYPLKESRGLFRNMMDESERQLRRAEQLNAQLKSHNDLATQALLRDISLQLSTPFSTAFGHLLDLVKLHYISQNDRRGINVVAILLLPGIFVSALLSSSIFDNASNSVALWFSIAIPLTFVATLAVLYAWRIPIIYGRIKNQGGLWPFLFGPK
jgi:hypothetical protein